MRTTGNVREVPVGSPRHVRQHQDGGRVHPALALKLSRVQFRVLVVAVVFALAGCGGSTGDSEPEASDEPEQEEAAEPEAKSERCLDVPPEIVDTILAGLTVTGGGTLRDAQMVKSSDFEAIWFVSAEIDGSQIEGDGEIGTWATNAPKDGYGLTYSVDGYAKEFSDWGDGGKTDANFSMSDDGAEESKDCVRQSGSG